MAIIDPQGLFNGKRLRRCSALARLYWPYLFLVSNGFARIELDFDAISHTFASFGAAAPSSAEIAGYFSEYEKNDLLYPFAADGQNWGQWDTRRSWLKDFKTSSDKRSPSPPEPDYRRWLQKQHGSEWPLYHWNKIVGDEPASTVGNTASLQVLTEVFPNANQQLPESCSNVAQDLALGGGGGGGVGSGNGNGNGVGGGEGEGTSPPKATFSNADESRGASSGLRLASQLLDELGIPTNPSLLVDVSKGIHAKAKTEDISLEAAYDFILMKARQAKNEASTKPWCFYFKDAQYDRRTRQEQIDEWVRRHS